METLLESLHIAWHRTSLDNYHFSEVQVILYVTQEKRKKVVISMCVGVCLYIFHLKFANIFINLEASVHSKLAVKIFIGQHCDIKILHVTCVRANDLVSVSWDTRYSHSNCRSKRRTKYL